MLIGVVFTAIGVGALRFTGSILTTWYRMSSWDAVPAQVLYVTLNQRHGEHSTLYKTLAGYRYEYGGRQYTSERVSQFGAYDNLGDFQQRLYRELSGARERGSTVTAYVDPARPADATLNRDLPPRQLAFPLMFGVVGCGLGLAAFFGARSEIKRRGQERKLRLRFPHEPWHWRPEWATTRIVGNNRMTTYMAVTWAALWNAVVLPYTMLMTSDMAGLTATAVAVATPLMGIWLAIRATRAWWQLRRYDVAALILERLPVPLGGRMRGVVQVAARVPIDAEFRLELCCIETRRRAGSNQSSERTLWRAQTVVARNLCQFGPGETSVPFDIAVPANRPATMTSPDASIDWYLDVAGECPGPDFWSRFDLPVFAVDETGSALEDPDVVAGPRPDRRELIELGIDFRQLPGGGERWTFKPARHAGSAALVTLIAMSFAPATVQLFTTEGMRAIALGFLCLDLVLAFWSLSLWLTEYRVTLDHGQLTLATAGFSITRPVRIPLAWVTQIQAKRSVQGGFKLCYDLLVQTEDGTHTAALGVDDYDVASWLANHWKSQGRNTA
jgi:hypothetical protein